MSTTEVKKELVKKSEKVFSSNKICFQPCLSFMPALSEVLRRSDEPFQDKEPICEPHCLRCERVGFVSDGVPT
jgi:hypothetical protein